MPVLTAIDTLGIQHYVFVTNRLKDAVGGSYLVEQLPHWIGQTCQNAVELVAAAGNALLLFDTVADARKAMARLSRHVYEHAPDLEFVVAHHEFQPGGLAEAIQYALEKAVPLAKLARRPSVPLLGLGVTASCQETRLPAGKLSDDDRPRPIAHALAKRRNTQFSRLWEELLPCGGADFQRGKGPRVRLQYPLDLDDLGRTRDQRSLIGLVHVDANHIGAKLVEWLKGQSEAGVDDATLTVQYRALSGGITALGRAALQRVIDRVVAAIGYDDDTENYQIWSRRLDRAFDLKLAELDDGSQVLRLPIRPLIVAGDELTFVCDGRIALDLAETALAVYETASLKDFGAVRACAGVAITRTHAPIIRAFEQAEELCQSAKVRVRDLASPQDVCALDWHIGFRPPNESLATLRRRQYKSEDRSLTCRAYLLGDAENPQEETWRWLDRAVLGSPTVPESFHGEYWSARRSKVKTLRSLARDGAEAVKQALAAWRVAAPTDSTELTLPGGLANGGYIAKRTPLLDAIELLDIHMPLEI